MNHNETLVKIIKEENRNIRRNIIDLRKVIKQMELQYKNNNKKILESCEHNWIIEPRTSCYDSVSYICTKCRSEKY
jgi:hypothetical protein